MEWNIRVCLLWCKLKKRLLDTSLLNCLRDATLFEHADQQQRPCPNMALSASKKPTKVIEGRVHREDSPWID